jgi:hypothetical protein
LIGTAYGGAPRAGDRELPSSSAIGRRTVHQPKNKFEALRGAVLIALGVLVGLGGNIASLYLAR